MMACVEALAVPPGDERDEAVVPASLVRAVGYHLRVAQEASSASFLRGVGDRSLKPGRYAVLSVLAHSPGCGPSALGRAVGRDKSTITATLRDLEADGYVQRRRRAADGRGIALTMTPAGHGLLARLQVHADAHDRRLDAIVGADKGRFVEILARIADLLGGDTDMDGAATGGLGT